MLRFAIIMAAALALCPAIGRAQTTGAEAFSLRDFTKAEELWRQEAADGSARAMLGLGLLADRGYSGARDFDIAYDWYLKAAELGLAEAQFNIAVMHDAGLGRQRDTAQALVWYTRAALRDYPRAQYNLGLLYESGDGVSANADLARYWFARAAADVPAAAAKSVEAVTSPAPLTPPEVLFADISPHSVELVWTAPATDNAAFMVEILQTPDHGTDYLTPIMAREAEGSGLLLRDIATQDDAIWRIVKHSADGRDYAATPWQGVTGQKGPKGRITMIVDDAIPAISAAATIFADDLRNAGYWVRVQTGGLPDSLDGISVTYGYEADWHMADIVARYLPGPADKKKVAIQSDSTQPSEILVYFSANQ